MKSKLTIAGLSALLATSIIVNAFQAFNYDKYNEMYAKSIALSQEQTQNISDELDRLLALKDLDSKAYEAKIKDLQLQLKAIGDGSGAELASLTDDFDKFLQKQKVDENGNPVFDENGNPVMENTDVAGLQAQIDANEQAYKDLVTWTEDKMQGYEREWRLEDEEKVSKVSTAYESMKTAILGDGTHEDYPVANLTGVGNLYIKNINTDAMNSFIESDVKSELIDQLNFVNRPLERTVESIECSISGITYIPVEMMDYDMIDHAAGMHGFVVHEKLSIPFIAQLSDGSVFTEVYEMDVAINSHPDLFIIAQNPAYNGLYPVGTISDDAVFNMSQDDWNALPHTAQNF